MQCRRHSRHTSLLSNLCDCSSCHPCPYSEPIFQSHLHLFFLPSWSNIRVNHTRPAQHLSADRAWVHGANLYGSCYATCYVSPLTCSGLFNLSPVYIYTVLLCANSLLHQSHRQPLEVYLKCLKRKERSMQPAIPVFDYLRIFGLS